MLRLLESIFGVGEVKEGCPDSLVKDSVERAVDGTDPCLRVVSGYKRKLRPAVCLALNYVNALVDALPTSRPVGLGSRRDDSLIRALFISADEMRQVFNNDRNLGNFLGNAATMPERVFALLVMEKNERVSFGAEMSGDTVEREQPRKFVSFDAHRLMDPSGDESENRRLLKRRAYDHLVSLALSRITELKTERRDLERRSELLQVKLSLLRRTGCGFDGTDSTDSPDIPELEEQLGWIESQLLKTGGDHILDAYLDIVISVLGRPEEHLWGKLETMILDSMGIRRNDVVGNACRLTFHELLNSEGRSVVVLPVVLDCGEIRNLKTLSNP